MFARGRPRCLLIGKRCLLVALFSSLLLLLLLYFQFWSVSHEYCKICIYVNNTPYNAHGTVPTKVYVSGGIYFGRRRQQRRNNNENEKNDRIKLKDNREEKMLHCRRVLYQRVACVTLTHFRACDIISREIARIAQLERMHDFTWGITHFEIILLYMHTLKIKHFPRVVYSSGTKKHTKPNRSSSSNNNRSIRRAKGESARNNRSRWIQTGEGLAKRLLSIGFH